MKLVDRDNILAQDEGDADYLNTRGTKGNRWKHLGIREDNQTPDTGGRASYLKQEGKVSDLFKIKQEMTRQNMKQNINHDS